MLVLLGGAGLSGQQSALAYHALVEFVVGSAAIDSRAGATSEADVDRDHEEWRATYAQTGQQDFPTTAGLARWLYPSQEEQFSFGLALLVESLAARLPVPGP